MRSCAGQSRQVHRYAAYVLHCDPAYKHARHSIGWTSGDDVTARLNVHLQGRGFLLVRATVEAGVDVQLAATYQGTRYLERRLKRWHDQPVLRDLRECRGGRAG